VTPSFFDVVVVAWNHHDTLPDCLAAIALAARRGPAIGRVVVVDNASSPPVTIDPALSLPGVVIRNADNVGFAAGCNQGAAMGAAPFLLFLNPDTKVDADALRTAGAWLDRPDAARVGAVGLQLVDRDGRPEPSCGRTLTPGRIFNQVTGLSALAPGFCPGFRMTDWDHRTTRRVDFASGAALIVRRQVFDALGGFEARLVVYLEDADLARRSAVAGWETWFLATAPVTHRSGWASGRDRAWRLANSWRSLWRYAGKHFGWPGALGVRSLVLMGAPAARLALAVLRRSARDARDTVRGYFIFLRMLRHPSEPWPLPVRPRPAAPPPA
jgi:GT2 family glycosyltransferase